MIGNWGITNVLSNSNMTFSFWINIPTLSSDWTSILHITNNNQDCCDNGRRVPGLWLWPNSTKLYLSVGLENGQGNFIVPPTNNKNTSPEIGINKPTFVTFTFNNKTISLYLNGFLSYTYNCPSKLTKTLSNAFFYCPDPWYKPQQVYATIKNLCFYDKSLSTNEIYNSYKLQKNNSISTWVLPCTYNWYSLNNSGQNMGKWDISEIIPSSNYMSFSFWVNIPKINSSNWTSIFHISNQNINCCNVGNRVPAVWLHPNSTQLYVVNDQINKGNTSISSKNYIGLNNYTYITITIETNKISIYFNGKLDNSKTFSDTLQPATSDAYFYSPDIWYPSKYIYSQIKDLTFYNTVLDQEKVEYLYTQSKKEVYYIPTSTYWTLENTKNKWYQLNKSNLIGNWGETQISSSNNMNICFWIKVTNLSSDWSSILHITNQNVNCCNIGNRVPALWLYPNSTKLLVVTDSKNKGNTSISSNTDIKMNTDTFISINININKVDIYLNGVLNHSYTYSSNLETANENAYFYCPDPWYNPEKSGVSIKNLTFYNSSLSEEQIKVLYEESNRDSTIVPTNCVGSFGDCSKNCKTTFSIKTPAKNGGKDCQYSDGYTKSCTGGGCIPSSSNGPVTNIPVANLPNQLSDVHHHHHHNKRPWWDNIF
jgi:hypothetical protein